MFNKITNNERFIPSTILGIAFILGVIIAGGFFYSIKSFDNTITVTGSTKQAIEADKGKLVITFTRVTTIPNLKSGYDRMANDLKEVKLFLATKGFGDADYTVSTVFRDEIYDNRQLNADYKEYTLRQLVEVVSTDVQKIQALVASVPALVEKGIVIQPSQPDYQYTKLPELRVRLLSAAIADAKERAESIVGSTGQSVGKLKSAKSGVVQVLTAGSNDVSDYGSYDTSSIKKDVMVTVNATFQLK